MLDKFNSKLLFIEFMLVGLSVTSFVFVASAKEITEGIETAVQDVKQSIGVLVNIKDNDKLSEEEKQEKKFEAAKNALTSVINLGLKEISIFKEKLNEMEIEQLAASDYTFDASETNENLIKMLDYYGAYHKDMLKRIELLRDYSEAQKLAKDIKTWRNEVYRAGIKKILSLELVLKNKEIVKISSKRFDKILSDLKKLKNAKLITLSSIEPLLDSITGNKKAIAALDEEITGIILKMLKSPTPVASNQKNNENALISDHKLISNLVEQSFLKTKEIYKGFIEINELVKKMIGVD